MEKLEIAEELGLIDKIKDGGYRNLTARESGRIGGIIAGRRRKNGGENNQFTSRNS